MINLTCVPLLDVDSRTYNYSNAEALLCDSGAWYANGLLICH